MDICLKKYVITKKMYLVNNKIRTYYYKKKIQLLLFNYIPNTCK